MLGLYYYCYVSYQRGKAEWREREREREDKSRRGRFAAKGSFLACVWCRVWVMMDYILGLCNLFDTNCMFFWLFFSTLIVLL